MSHNNVSRRAFLRLGLTGLASIASLPVLNKLAPGQDQPQKLPVAGPATPAKVDRFTHSGHEHSGTVGDVDTSRFDPMKFLTDFDYGRVSKLPNGQTLREWDIDAGDVEIEVAPGVFYPAWSYNGQVPGPTFRCTQGDRLRFNFRNGSAHPHTIHFHGIHPPSMDGVEPVVQPGGQFVYEFDAKPFGLHPYHCHTLPLARHIHKGLYGAFIVDPPGDGRPPAKEMIMIMNGFDTNFDGENEIYAVNSVAFHYSKHPIQVKVGELIRIYLVNMTEFDPINSFHLHAGMFKLYRTGTRLDHYEYTDNVLMGQGERHVLEFTLEYPGKYMFHAHQSELAELGWMGFFEATE
ncbi:MAG: multicopper oxidase domain-containing protein [Chloroflexota bacterium]|nr:multicopper oxidase domain-containing protein [Chloroflexota bacterium]